MISSKDLQNLDESKNKTQIPYQIFSYKITSSQFIPGPQITKTNKQNEFRCCYFIQLLLRKMWKLFSSFFGGQCVMQEVLKKQTALQVRRKPIKLIKELREGKLSKFISVINEQPQAPLLALRKLTLVHYIVLHDPQLCDFFVQVNLKIETEDVWLNQNIIRPYNIFLYKVLNSSGLYAKCKTSNILQISFKMLFYTINMLKYLFPCVKKMSSLSRYYSKIEKDLQCNLTYDYVMVHAFEAQDLYNCFKAILGEMMSKPQIYVKTDDQKRMIKYVIEDELTKLNEEMKNLFLDKYYFPYGQGYVVKLLREEDLQGRSREFVDSLATLDYGIRVKKTKKLTLDKILFSQRGHLNPQVFLSLSQMIRPDDSILLSQRNSSMTQCPMRLEEREEITEII